jgi:hypothetical protein
MRIMVILVVLLVIAMAVALVSPWLLGDGLKPFQVQLVPPPSDENLVLIKSLQAQVTELEEKIRGVDHYYEAYRIRFERDIDTLLEKVNKLEESRTLIPSWGGSRRTQPLKRVSQ